MKKIIMILMALCLAMPGAFAELTKDQLKRNEKMAKNTAKDLKKKGYENMAPYPLEETLLQFYNEKADKGLDFQPGESVPTRSKNNARQMAQASALNSYSLSINADIKGKTNNIAKAGLIPEAEVDNFESCFMAETQSQIRGDLKEMVSLCKQNPDGTYEVTIYYLVDPNAATNARARALEKAIEEQKLSNELADQVRKNYSL